MAGIYIHIPFCRKACSYCDFHFSTSLRLKTEMIQALLVEIETNRKYLKEDIIQTIYFGGGTPSLLEAGEINSIIQKICSVYTVSPKAEITLEANADDLSYEKARSLKELGVNRLSIGIQSFRNEDLKLMNRAHNRKMALDSLTYARKAGFDNLNLDLIYGIPGLSLQDWNLNLDELFRFRPEHISAYGMTIEERTAFGHKVKKGELVPASDEDFIAQFEVLIKRAGEMGYDHYEISNFSLPGRHSAHNTSYWTGEKYLGIGPSAHSFNGFSRRWNIRNNPLYIKAVLNKTTFYEEEILSEKDRFNEVVMTSLRTKWGLDLKKLSGNFSQEMCDKLMADAGNYLKSEQLRFSENKLFLTEKGKLVADKITSDLFAI